MLHNICILQHRLQAAGVPRKQRARMRARFADGSWRMCPNNDKYEYQYGNILEFYIF